MDKKSGPFQSGLTGDALLERILVLEAANVGCGPQCMCRAFAAAVMTDDQFAMLKEHTNQVVYDKVPSNEHIVKTKLGATDESDLGEILNHIAEDRDDASQDTIKGGEVGARLSVLELAKATLASHLFGPLVPSSAGA